MENLTLIALVESLRPAMSEVIIRRVIQHQPNGFIFQTRSAKLPAFRTHCRVRLQNGSTQQRIGDDVAHRRTAAEFTEYHPARCRETCAFLLFADHTTTWHRRVRSLRVPERGE